MLETRTLSCEVAGRKLTLETGKLAKQASGSVTVRYGDTIALVTAVNSHIERENSDFLPLTVDYEERMYAAGKIPGGFIRREGRPTTEATLASRLTDRTIRPLLPKTWRHEIQVVVTVLSTDQDNDPNLLGIIGASAALGMTEVPFAGPVSGVTVGYKDGKMVLNPLLSEMAESELDLVVCSTSKDIVMVEAGAKEVSEDILVEALKFGHEANQAILAFQAEFLQGLSKPKLPVPPAWDKPEIIAAINELAGARMAACIGIPDRDAREAEEKAIKQILAEKLKDKFAVADVFAGYDIRMKAMMRASILEKSFRMDGRGLLDIRPIGCEVSLLPRAHGSALFNRGETQVMTTVTLGSMAERQQLDGIGIEETKHYIHHYNFPPFSTGETGRIGTTGRREIGHGALAERALLPVIPDKEEFPYTLRLVSEALGSNGSTSMASTCGSTLALMDAGVPIKRPVSGIAMGLVTDDKGNYAVLNDIAGVEDFFGDMDFKVAGTTQGITALQLDIKLKGISLEILEKAIRQAHDGRDYILGIMLKTISAPRSEISLFAPRMYKIKINTEKIGTVIGPGGKMIRSIIEETKCTIDIDDTGTVVIGSADEKSARRAIEIIESLTKEIEPGAIYTGKVSRILNFGAMVEIAPGKEGLVHVSELAETRVEKVEDVVAVGDEITVKVIEIDHMGRVNLSRKAMFAKPGEEPRPRSSRPEGRPPQRDSRGGGRPPFRGNSRR
ncbi:MAG TPA: polyribonucleotide nucleotidyltransferase [Dehalococcoidales bacterium]|nr:polyribonucleotide nucleotidyltransferase [Dehalococcoidales bacterium]